MAKVGDRVKIHRHGTSIFVITAIEDGRGLIEALGDSAGKYPFTCDLASLVPVDYGIDSNGPVA
jgi:hypothetical protein